MILLDPDLEPGPARCLQTALASNSATRIRVSRNDRIPSVPILLRFLAQAQAAVRLKGHVTVLLTTDAALRKLNRRFRSRNAPTDVLSFPADTTVQDEEQGDLAISVETARKQAAEQGHALASELKILMLHGLLHLAGHDHETDRGAMARREMKLRAKLGLPQGLIERADAAEPSALKGHGFSRAAQRPKPGSALAAGGVPVAKKAIPQGLKPRQFLPTRSARLKSGPDTKPLQDGNSKPLLDGISGRFAKSRPFRATSRDEFTTPGTSTVRGKRRTEAAKP